MIPGLNHNIMQNGNMYHIQTEDSGVKNPVIVTHLFVDGTILATERTNYQEFVTLPEPEMRDKVIKLMTKSHRMMINKLVTGGYAHLEKKKTAEVVEQVSEDVLPELDSKTGESVEKMSRIVDRELSQAEGVKEERHRKERKPTEPRDRSIPIEASSTQVKPLQKTDDFNNLFEGSASLNIYVLMGYNQPRRQTPGIKSLRKGIIDALAIAEN